MVQTLDISKLENQRLWQKPNSFLRSALQSVDIEKTEC